MRHYSMNLFLGLACAALITACSPRYTASFQASSPAGYGAHPEPAQTEQETVARESAVEVATIEEEVTPVIAEVKSPLERAMETQTLPTKREDLSDADQQLLQQLENSSLERQRQILRAEAKRNFKQLSRAERKAMKQELREAVSYYRSQRKLSKHNPESPQRHADSEEMFIIVVILSVLIPPLGVFLHEQEFNANFWISLGLFALIFLSLGVGWLLSAVWSVLVSLDVVTAI